MAPESWKFPMASGALLMAFGLGALVAPPVVAAGLVSRVAALFLVGGAAQLARSSSRPAHQSARLSTVVALVFVATGALMRIFPAAPTFGLTTLVLGFLLVSGVAKLLASALMAGVPGRLGTTMSGLVSMALAFIVTSTLPESAISLLGAAIGVDIFFTGAALLGLGWASRREELTHPHRLHFHARLPVA